MLSILPILCIIQCILPSMQCCVSLVLTQCQVLYLLHHETVWYSCRFMYNVIRILLRRELGCHLLCYSAASPLILMASLPTRRVASSLFLHLFSYSQIFTHAYTLLYHHYFFVSFLIFLYLHSRLLQDKVLYELGQRIFYNKYIHSMILIQTKET